MFKNKRILGLKLFTHIKNITKIILLAISSIILICNISFAEDACVKAIGKENVLQEVKFKYIKPNTKKYIDLKNILFEIYKPSQEVIDFAKQICREEKGESSYCYEANKNNFGFELSRIDLNNDKQEENLTVVIPAYCPGSGCPTLKIFQNKNIIFDRESLKEEMLVSNNITQGYHDLLFCDNMGTKEEPVRYISRYVWNGKKYEHKEFFLVNEFFQKWFTNAGYPIEKIKARNEAKITIRK